MSKKYIADSFTKTGGTSAQFLKADGSVDSSILASEGYVDGAITALVDSSPTTLDTLNELAAALGDDPNFATTVTNSIATKLPLAGGTLTGALVINTASNGLPSVSLSHSNASADNFLITAEFRGLVTQVSQLEMLMLLLID